jgi:hypothetical protein
MTGENPKSNEVNLHYELIFPMDFIDERNHSPLRMKSTSFPTFSGGVSGVIP